MLNEKYLFIGGSTKCGTTSVFSYFEFHPEVCPCVMKESRYFWMNEYPLEAATRDKDKYHSFHELFKNCDSNKLRMEATPDYLYSSATAKKIKEQIPEAKIVFILRNPVDRMWSWFKFAKLNGLIDQLQTFNEYVKLQFNNFDPTRPQHLRALEQGNYYSCIKTYINLFGTENILITFYEDLASDPLAFCEQICHFSGINSNYFKSYNFKVYNQSIGTRSVSAHKFFRKLKRFIRPVTKLFHESLRKRLKLAGYSIEQAYTSANKSKEVTNFEIDNDLKMRLEKYYRIDRDQIHQLTGKNIVWKTLADK